MLEISTTGRRKAKVHLLLRIYRKVLITICVLVALAASADFAYAWYNKIYAGTPMTVVTYKLAQPSKKPAGSTAVKPGSSPQQAQSAAH